MAAALSRRARSGWIPRRAPGRDDVPLRPDPRCGRRLLVHREPRFTRRARVTRAGLPPLRLLPAFPYRIGTDARAGPVGIDGSAMTGISVVGRLDANFAWDGERLYEPPATRPARLP